MENPSDQLRPGRLFIHGRLNDPITGGPLYCRIRAFEGDLVEYETIYHREDGSERICSPASTAGVRKSRTPSPRVIPPSPGAVGQISHLFFQ